MARGKKQLILVRRKLQVQLLSRWTKKCEHLFKNDIFWVFPEWFSRPSEIHYWTQLVTIRHQDVFLRLIWGIFSLSLLRDIIVDLGFFWLSKIVVFFENWLIFTFSHYLGKLAWDMIIFSDVCLPEEVVNRIFRQNLSIIFLHFVFFRAWWWP